MKKGLIIGLAVLMVVAFSGIAMALTIDGSGSGHLLHNFSNTTYTDLGEVFCADFLLNTTYTSDSVTRTFEIRQTYNYSQPGMYGTSPTPGVFDWGKFQSTEVATGTWAYNDLSYETVYPGPYQPGPGVVHADSFVDFTAQTANIYNYIAAAGERVMSQEVGSPTLSSGYNNTVWSYTPGSNASNKLTTNAAFGAKTTVNGHGAYSPDHLNVNFQNVDGLTVWNINQTASPPPATGAPNSFFNTVGIYHQGNSYVFDNSGIKGADFYYNIDN